MARKRDSLTQIKTEADSDYEREPSEGADPMRISTDMGSIVNQFIEKKILARASSQKKRRVNRLVNPQVSQSPVARETKALSGDKHQDNF